MSDKARGNETYSNIIKASLKLASVEGLDGISIGKLANEVGMSKSGLFSHFGSKKGLQLATLDAASEVFIEYVVIPAKKHTPPGIKRLWSFCEHWLLYIQKRIFPGGCFFSSVSAEYDDRPGVIHDKIAKIMKSWMNRLSQEIKYCQKKGEIKKEVKPDQIAFFFQSLVMGANWAYQLYDQKKAIDYAREGMKNLIIQSKEKNVDFS